MTAPPTLAQARAAWLAGDGAAWTRYTACLRDLADAPAPPRRRDDRGRTARRARRRGRIARG